MIRQPTPEKEITLTKIIMTLNEVKFSRKYFFSLLLIGTSDFDFVYYIKVLQILLHLFR
jgi:hypothetical protein